MNLYDIRQGETLPGDNGSDPQVKPTWLDVEKFNRGRKFFMDHLVSILLAMYCSLVSGLSVVNLLDALVHTGMTDTPEKSIKRYMSTARHVVLWHLGDVWDPNDVAFKSVQNVRAIHARVSKSMNNDKTNGKGFVSQYDMALVQCGFMGAAVMYPDYGIKCSKSDLSDYIHFWRGIGHLLGVEDSYNICSGSYDDTYDICKQIELKVVRPAVKSPPKDFMLLSSAFITGSNNILPITIFTYDSIFAWIFRVWKDQTYEFEREKCTLYLLDRFRVLCFQTFCWMLMTFPSFERLINEWLVGKCYTYFRYSKPYQ